MTSINRLSSDDALSQGDLVPIYSNGQGVTRKATAAAFVAAIGDSYVTQAQAQANAATATVAAFQSMVYPGVYAIFPTTRPNGTAMQDGDRAVILLGGVPTEYIRSAGTWVTNSGSSPAALAASSGSALVGFIQSGTGSAPQTLQDKGRQTVNVLDFYANGASGARVDPTGVTDSTLGIQAAIDTGAARVEFPKGTFLFSTLTIKTSLREFVGSGSTQTDTYLKRKTGATGAAIAWDGTNRNIGCFIGHFRMDGNSGVGETYGMDLSGFSYCTFENIWARAFTLDGIYADGSITPTNKQFSNNTFTNVRSNNNLRDGWHFVGGVLANSANVYVGCEGAGNGAIGFNEINGFANQVVGCTFQGNATRNFYTGGTIGKYDIYSEGLPFAVELSATSGGNAISTRSEYPLWNTFIDNGFNNTISVRGEQQPERDLFINPYLASWGGSLPDGIALNGTPTLASASDVTSPALADVQVTVNANLQGIFFSLMDSGARLQGTWVTLLLDVDTSGVIDTLNTRVYTRDGATGNTANGQFAIQTLPVTSAGVYKTLAFDVKFAATIAGVPTVAWYMGYSGVVGSNVIKIRRARILAGQTRTASRLAVEDHTQSMTAAAIAVAANGLNIHRKSAGRFVYDSTAGKMRFALNATPTGAWRATDGSGDITPS